MNKDYQAEFGEFVRNKGRGYKKPSAEEAMPTQIKVMFIGAQESELVKVKHLGMSGMAVNG